MDQKQPEPSFQESVSSIMKEMPPIIRNYLVQGKYSIVARQLVSKYGLHIDQGVILEREIMLLIMGLEDLQEFTQTLSEEVKLDRKTIEGILQDINTQIFAPLRQEEGRMNKVSPTIPPAPPQRVIPPRPVNAGVPSYAPPLQSPRYAPPINKIPPTESAPVFQPKKEPAPWGSFNKPAQQPQKNISNMPLRAAITSAQQPISSGRMLEDHEEPHIEFSEKPSVPVPPQRAPISPAAVMPQRSVTPPAMTLQPQRNAAPPNLPGVIQPGVIPPGGRPSFSPTPKIAPPPSEQPVTPPRPPVPMSPQQGMVQPKTPIPPAPKSYSTDPYREPVDE